MVWDCFRSKCRGRLEFPKKGEMMKGARNLQLLKDKLELFMRIHRTSNFLQDGTPCHKSKVVTVWFAERPTITLIK
jgi:hypothetical protein